MRKEDRFYEGILKGEKVMKKFKTAIMILFATLMLCVAVNALEYAQIPISRTRDEPSMEVIASESIPPVQLSAVAMVNEFLLRLSTQT